MQPLVGAVPDALRRESHPSSVSLCPLRKLLLRSLGATPQSLSTTHWIAFCRFRLEVASPQLPGTLPVSLGVFSYLFPFSFLSHVP